MNYSRDKRINELVRAEIAGGAWFRRGRKHSKLYLPGCRFIVVPSTPSDRRAAMNFRADLRARRRSIQ